MCPCGVVVAHGGRIGAVWGGPAAVQRHGILQQAQHQPTTPGYLLQLAVQQGADLEKLERLMALQERWEAAEAKRAFVAAMAAFKAEPMTIFKKKQVGYTTKDGDFVGYTHARLADVTDVVVPAMGRHGLSHRWDIRQDGGRIHVSCIVTHRLGHSETVVMDCPPDSSGKKNPLQQIASATSYLQRYTLLAVTGMATKDMDNDGAGAKQKPVEPPPPGYENWHADMVALADSGLEALTKSWSNSEAAFRRYCKEEGLTFIGDAATNNEINQAEGSGK